ncbi:NirD/YgiW/YdeI family stress tolerance protein [Desulfovibrio sp. 86]|uniref:Uncharacterized protein n=1 Tax=uncultured Desulfovibrio sp. TaxID=167968 RepID=A0A212L8T1_9BACT|nr:NirD/YgiW/YdeI family stress tolerance protein [Desulfovibrio sp. 86]SCM73983.1 conserved exported hypothetical protein [uncultured Desulfovibrio sp.]VZH34566.1 conserved exported protein of unknown function [Desulfovibrio sp. 86]
MRYLLVLIVAAAIALPVQAANAAGNTASVGDSQGVAAPTPRKAPHGQKQSVAKLQEVDTIAKALTAPNKSPATIVGNIVEKVAGKKNHYIVDDGTGRMTVAIGPKALKGMNLTPDMKVSLKGRIRAAAGKAPVMGVRAVTIIK